MKIRRLLKIVGHFQKTALILTAFLICSPSGWMVVMEYRNLYPSPFDIPCWILDIRPFC